MANPISSEMRIGTLGELLVQLRLLQFDVQAAPPLKDSGNDLIAVNCLHEHAKPLTQRVGASEAHLAAHAVTLRIDASDP
jgi:hypothetical protein